MRKLTIQEITELANLPGVKPVAVENFLMTVHVNKSAVAALLNLERDRRMYGWNDETVRAIQKGILLAENDFK